jgi:hypothetical protein
MRKGSFLVFSLIVLWFVSLGSVPASRADDPDLGAKVDKLFEKWNSIDSPGAAVAQKKDLFLAGGFAKIQFQRDGNGVITGFLISTNRVLNLKFAKLKP